MKKKLSRISPQQEGHPLASAESKAARLKRIRNLANLSREDLCSDSGINLTTLISWEVGRFGGLTHKGALRVIERVAKEGVFCTPEWLLYEIGSPPEVHVNFKNSKVKELPITKITDEKEKIIAELMLFRKLNENTIDSIINDDAMLPHYKKGDYVAGTKRRGQKIKTLYQCNCIIETSNGLITVRTLLPGSRDMFFTLIGTNLCSKSKNLIMYDIDIVHAAPILWHRQYEP